MQRLIFDTDLGIDDALALLYVLNSPEAHIEAITTVHGNVPVDVATANVFEVLAVAGVATPPDIAQGAAKPLSGECVHATEVHAADGLGGWTRNGRVAPLSVRSGPASHLICEVARRFRGEVTLLLIGPATNAALALREDPKGFRQLQRIVIMGGAIWEPGNVTATAEFNLYADPEAARAVIQSGLPITMIGLDVTRKVSITRELFDRYVQLRDDPRSQFLRCLATQGFSFYTQTTGWEGFYLHDPLAAAVAIDPSLVKTHRLRIDVETRGDLTRGMLVAERRSWKSGGENVDYCIEVKAEAFLDRFYERVLATFIGESLPTGGV